MRRGFTLVELAIVLVIIGLLVGGVLAGQSLIRAAGLHSVVADMASYSAAVQTFRGKYFALPGDMNNATQFWGSAGGNGADAACDAALTQASKAVCNGNGDGFIEGAAIAYNERYYAWKELANAGLVAGSFTGQSTGGAGSAYVVAGVDSPATKLSDVVYTFATVINGQVGLFSGQYGFNTLFVYGPNAANGSSTPPFKPEEVWNMDSKLDDGRPGTGKFFVGKATGGLTPGCATTDDPATAEYSLQSSSKLCGFWFAVQ